MLQTIVCAVDDSPGAAEAIEVAAALSSGLGLRLVLAHVVDGYRRANGVGTGGTQADRRGQRLLERVARQHSLERGADAVWKSGAPPASSRGSLARRWRW